MKNKTALKLKEVGLRVTPQRQAILELLDGNRTHPSAESIFHEMKKGFPGISFATVYNTLSTFSKAGQIQELDIDPTKKRFDTCLAPHGHFYCKVCGEIFDVAFDTSLLVNTRPLNTKNVDGHQIDTIQVDFQGVCKDCRKKR